MTTTGDPRVDQPRAEPGTAPIDLPVTKQAAAQPTAVAQLRSALADLTDAADRADRADRAEAPGRSAATRTRGAHRPECRVARAALHDYLHGRLAPSRHLGRDAKLRNWTSVFTFFRDVRYELRDLAFTVDENLAVAHGFGRLSGTLASGAETGAETSGMWVRVTLCFRRVDGDWLIAHDQVSVPFDLRSGRGVADLEP